MVAVAGGAKVEAHSAAICTTMTSANQRSLLARERQQITTHCLCDNTALLHTLATYAVAEVETVGAGRGSPCCLVVPAMRFGVF